MKLIDFFIGYTLMNAMPHFVLGIWNARILSLFGFGNKQNIAYSLLNFLLSISLFSYEYGFLSILNNGIYAGALAILVIYYLAGNFIKNLFSKN